LNICKHLQPILNLELARGNVIVDYSEAWTKVVIAVTLQDPIDLSGINTFVIDPVILWKNADTHYALQEGVLCTSCKQSIAGPLYDSGSE
jgi:hypothetical protein